MARCEKSSLLIPACRIAAGIMALLACAAPLSAGPAKVELSPEQPSIELATAALHYLDAQGKVTSEDIASGAVSLAPYGRQSFQFGFRRGALWAQSHITASKEVPWTTAYLVFDNSSLGSITLYAPVIDGGERSIRVLNGGWQNASGSSQIPFIYPTFRIPADYDDSRPLTIAVSTPYALQFRATLFTRDQFIATGFALFLIIGFCSGTLIAMLLYNLFIYTQVGERHYLYYVLYVLAQLVYQCVLFGIVPYLWPRTGLFLTSHITVLSALMIISVLAFTRSFLDTRTTARRHDVLIIMMIAMMGAVIVMELSGRKWIATVTSYIIATASILAQLTASLSSIKYGFRPARYFLLASSVLMASASVFIFRFYGILPNNSFTLHALFFGTAVESVLLSFALGYRIRVLREEGERARDRERKLRRMSVTDELTGLFNRRFFNSRLEEYIQTARREKLPLSLLMLDVDHFKRFNDTYGHPEGDSVLAILGDIIRSSLRERDIPCRYGGEEFAVILHNTGESDARAVAGRIRERFAGREHFPLHDIRVIMTVSIGVTEYRRGEEATVFVKRCDRALYRAKELGRNMVVAEQVEGD